MMSQGNKSTHRRELLCVILLLVLVSLLYQCYANTTFWHFSTKPNNALRPPGCPVTLEKEPVRDDLIFPALRNFSVKENIGALFGRFPLLPKQLRLTHNFTDRLLFAFMPAMTPQEKLVSLFVFQKFINICTQYNITFFIQGGTLLGAYRHHGFVPWDDDIDVYVHMKDREKLFCSLKMAAPTFDIRQYPRFQWKFFYTQAPTLRAYTYRWPFVDIFFYTVEGDNIYDVTNGRKTRAFKHHNVFPLGTSIFEGAELPSPCNLEVSINAVRFRTLNTCHTGSYIHKLEKSKINMIVKSVACKKLYGIYPFVFRTKRNVSEDKVEEVLKIGSHVLRAVTVRTGCSAKENVF